jgi:glutaredoxin
VHLNAAKAHVIIYSRPGCHLCEEAKQAIAAAQCLDEYTLEEINIESDPDLLRRYRYDIPVITINDVEAFRHRLTAEEFRLAIARSC